jgi:tetratricopeptide (TPR) repeat protein
MGRKSKFQNRLKNPESFLQQKEELKNLEQDDHERYQIMRQNRWATRFPEVVLKKIKIPLVHDPEEDVKILNLENKIKIDQANADDYLTLDILYLQLDMRNKHLKLWPQIQNRFTNANFLPFLEGFDNFMYIKNNTHTKKLFDDALQSGCHLPLLYLTYGNVYSREKNVDMAKKLYFQSIELDPKFAVPWFNLGILELEAKNYTKAEEFFLHSLYADLFYFKGYLGLFQLNMLEINDLFKGPLAGINWNQILKIPLVLAPYLPEIQKLYEFLDLDYSELNKYIQMSVTQRTPIKHQLQQVWEALRIQSFDQVVTHKQELYSALLKFSVSL